MKFRVLSDLHLDINQSYPLELADKSVFTVICGDTSGYPDMTIDWIRRNVERGVGVSGNHLPYNDLCESVQNMRERLAAAFPASAGFTYLDCETGTFHKVVDGILFAGSCMYSDFGISHKYWNKDGDVEFNMRCSEYNMNDYRFGMVDDGFGGLRRMRASDCLGWFNNAFAKLDGLLKDNEASPSPLPVVLVTHFNLLPDYLTKSYYVSDAAYLDRPTDFNWSSYASDRSAWLAGFPHLKCYCCGHIHDVFDDVRHFRMPAADGHSVLVVNNARGYCQRGHDRSFNADRYVDTETWEVVEDPIPAEVKAKREERARLYFPWNFS